MYVATDDRFEKASNMYRLNQLNCTDLRGLSMCNRYGYKEPVIIRWGSHVRMFLGGVGRDRIQLDRLTYGIV